MKRSNIFGGIILIFIGLVLLLVNLGYLQWNFFITFFSFWPIFLIALGLLIIFRGRLWVQILALLLILVLPFLYYFGVGSLNSLQFIRPNSINTYSVSRQKTEEYSWSMANEPKIEKAELDLAYGVGKVILDSLSSSSKLLDVKVVSSFGKPDISVNQRGSTAKISVEQAERSFFFIPGIVSNGGGREDCELNLNRDVIWALDLKTGVSQSIINLEDIKFNKLSAETGVGAVKFILGDMGIDADMELDAGVGELTIVIPKDVGVRVDVDTGLGAIDLPGSWQRKGDTYTNSKYSQANTNINLTIKQGIGKVEIVTK